MMRGSLALGAAFAATALTLGLSGCQSSGKTDADSRSGATGSEFDQGAMSDSGAGAGGSLPGMETIYFDYDRFEIRSDARESLRRNADLIGKNQGWGTVVVEGHCDERGSEEYNLALGERRADAVRRYLVDLGVASARLRTVSFGEAKPAVVGHDESAWRYNRRSEFKSSR